jgi:acyl carrier protein
MQSTSETELGMRIRSIVSDQLGVAKDEIRSESHIADDLGADSLDVVELVMQLEDEFDIEVPDEAAESIRTVGDVERYVAEHVPRQ